MFGNLSCRDVLWQLLQLDVLCVHVVAQLSDHVLTVGRAWLRCTCIFWVAAEPRHHKPRVALLGLYRLFPTTLAALEHDGGRLDACFGARDYDATHDHQLIDLRSCQITDEIPGDRGALDDYLPIHVIELSMHRHSDTDTIVVAVDPFA